MKYVWIEVSRDNSYAKTFDSYGDAENWIEENPNFSGSLWREDGILVKNCGEQR